MNTKERKEALKLFNMVLGHFQGLDFRLNEFIRDYHLNVPTWDLLFSKTQIIAMLKKDERLIKAKDSRDKRKTLYCTRVTIDKDEFFDAIIHALENDPNQDIRINTRFIWGNSLIESMCEKTLLNKSKIMQLAGIWGLFDNSAGKPYPIQIPHAYYMDIIQVKNLLGQ